MLNLSDLAKYGAVRAKIGVLKRGLLNADNYRELISLHSVSEVASYLKNETVYGNYFELSPQAVHRSELEILMKKAYTSDIVKLSKFDNEEIRKYFSILYVRAEIEWLKLALRRIAHGELNIDLLGDFPPFFKRRFTVDMEKLASSASLREFLANLAGSRYESVISPIINLKEHQNLFSVEMALEMYYYGLINRLKEELRDKEDKYVANLLFGTEVDMINLLWIYRCKNYYQIPSEQIYSFIIPNKHRLQRSDIMRLVEMGSVEGFLELVKSTPYRDAFLNEGFLDLNHASFIYKLHRIMLNKYPYTIEAVISYLYFRETEIKNITSAIEGIRYGLGPDEIKPYIIGFKL